MDRIAFIYEDVFIYWHSIILICGVLTAAFLFLALWLDRGGKWSTGAAAVSASAVLSLVLSRAIHWYSMSASYPSAKAAMTDYTTGGYALMGVFAGCILTACVLRALKTHRKLLTMLDCMAIAGAGGIAVGRLADLYTTADLGIELTGVASLPFAYPVQDTLTGEITYRLATFMLQSMTAAMIFAALLIVYFLRRQGKCAVADGDMTCLFLLLYCPSQIVLDSTRYDSLFFRGNGFVSIVQVLCAVGMVLSVVVFSVKMVLKRGWNYRYIPLWVGIASLLGGAGYMEYYVQRHGHQALFAYSMMSLCLIVAVGLTLAIYVLTNRKREISAANT